MQNEPRTKGILEGTLRNESSNAEYNNTKTVLERPKERKGNSANVAKRLLLGTVVGSTPLRSLRSSCKEFGVSFRTLKKAINDVKPMEDVRFITHMSRFRNKTVITDVTKTLVINFCNSAVHECPYKNSTVLVEGQRQPVKFLEKTLSEYFHIFKQENPTVKMGHTSFENLRPKNINLKSQAQRQVCCCIKHVNIDYLRTKLNELLRINNQPIIPDNEILVSETVC